MKRFHLSTLLLLTLLAGAFMWANLAERKLGVQLSGKSEKVTAGTGVTMWIDDVKLSEDLGTWLSAVV